ncbi:MAG: UDP-2,4-diacetamido-2,4,6-trideoxy-beta-L-altropyranose hydrolase [Pseudomonadota bacterium]
MLRFLARFDAGQGVGAGHMSRCLAIASEFERLGYEIYCQVNDGALHQIPQHLRERSSTTASGELFNFNLLPDNIDVALIDHYAIGQEHEHELRKRCATIVVLDDLANRTHDCDVLIDSAIGQDPDRYRSKTPDGSLRLIGPAYAPLRSTFRTGRIRMSENHHPAEARKALFISIGAVDSSNATSKIMKAIANVSDLSRITVVLSSQAPHLDTVRCQVQDIENAELVVDCHDMAQLVTDHDLAIGAPGVSALERACLGIPQVLLTTAPNQIANYQGLLDQEMAIGLGDMSELDDQVVGDTVVSFSSDHGLQHRLKQNGMRGIDGLGSRRIAALVHTIPKTRDGRRLSARPIRQQDGPKLYAWQINPSTRRYFRNPTAPTPQEHEKFMQSRLTVWRSISEVLTLDGEPVALVRADPAQPASNTYQVAIVVDPRMRGQSIGKAALGYLKGLMMSATLEAYISVDNKPSLSVFRSVGFGKCAHLKLAVI